MFFRFRERRLPFRARSSLPSYCLASRCHLRLFASINGVRYATSPFFISAPTSLPPDVEHFCRPQTITHHTHARPSAALVPTEGGQLGAGLLSVDVDVRMTLDPVREKALLHRTVVCAILSKLSSHANHCPSACGPFSVSPCSTMRSVSSGRRFRRTSQPALLSRLNPKILVHLELPAFTMPMSMPARLACI